MAENVEQIFGQKYSKKCIKLKSLFAAAFSNSALKNGLLGRLTCMNSSPTNVTWLVYCC